MFESKQLAGDHTSACFTTVEHTGTPQGHTAEFGSVPTYVVEGPGKRILLFCSDIFGAFYINNQLLQDYFASFGFTVLGIDFFLGDPVGPHLGDPTFDRPAWSANARERAPGLFDKWLEGVRAHYGIHGVTYCVVGYCFGGPYAAQLAATDAVVAAAIAHPANIPEDVIQAARQPLLFSCAQTDKSFSLDKRRRTEDILIEKNAQFMFQVFSGVNHGFAARGDPEVGDERWAKEEAARGMVGWFTRFAGEDEKTGGSTSL